MLPPTSSRSKLGRARCSLSAVLSATLSAVALLRVIWCAVVPDFYNGQLGYPLWEGSCL
jgi:hypothetical protein